VLFPPIPRYNVFSRTPFPTSYSLGCRGLLMVSPFPEAENFFALWTPPSPPGLHFGVGGSIFLGSHEPRSMEGCVPKEIRFNDFPPGPILNYRQLVRGSPFLAPRFPSPLVRSLLFGFADAHRACTPVWIDGVSTQTRVIPF